MKKTRIKNIVGGCLLAVVVIGVAPLLYAPVLGDLASMYAQRAFVPYALVGLAFALGLWLLGALREETPADILPAALLGAALLPLSELPFFGGYHGGNAAGGMLPLTPLGLFLLCTYLWMFVAGLVRGKGLGAFHGSHAAALACALLFAMLGEAAREGLLGYMEHGSAGQNALNGYLTWTAALLPIVCGLALLPILQRGRFGWLLLGLGAALLCLDLIALYTPAALSLTVTYLVDAKALSLHAALLIGGIVCLLPEAHKSRALARQSR